LKSEAEAKKSSTAADGEDIDDDSRAADRSQLITLQGLFRDAEAQIQVMKTQLDGSLMGCLHDYCPNAVYTDIIACRAKKTL
jgi:hypothetical protein